MEITRKETLPEEFSLDSTTLNQILDEMSKVIVGQEQMNRLMLIGLVSGGHVLLEGLPGLAKTLAVRTLANVIDAKFQRVQFTPDLLPSDLIGTVVYRPETQDFAAKKGPIFTNILLADEINRAPAKVQSALLEAMGEKQVTIGETTYPLEEPFLVLATQNPIEQEGTYPLPEAQLDRFLFKLRVHYPSRPQERMILDRNTTSVATNVRHISNATQILKMRTNADKVYLDERIKDYILRLVMGTRKEGELKPEEANSDGVTTLRRLIAIGASPRATLSLAKAARVHALLEKRHFVIPDDVKTIAPEVLRHRLILTFEAEAKGHTTEDVIQMLLTSISVP